MNKKITLWGMSFVALATLFVGAHFASAQGETTATCNSAVLSGTLTDTGGAATTVWFEWGTSFSAVNNGSGTRTASQVLSTPQSFTQNISGLSDSTTYYYRAMFSNRYGSANGSVLSFYTPACAPIATLPTVTTSSANAVAQTSAMLNGYETPNGASTSAWFEWGTTQSFGNTTSNVNYGMGATSFSGMIQSLSANTTYYFRAVAQNAQGTVYGSTMSFTTSGNVNNGSLPTVNTSSASSVSQNSAILNGYETPNGASTSAWFEWGTTQSFGNTTSNVNYGTSATSFSNSISGLSANTTYYFRAVAQNSQGTVYGSTMSFTTSGNTYSTLPSVSTRNADVSGNFASLNGYVDPNFTSDTVRWFEWGTTQSLGNTTSMLSQGTVASNYSAAVTGLSSNTSYYYRAVARNSQGTVYGSILSFVTTGQQVQNGVAPSVTTLLSTEVTGTTARLNGLVFAQNGQSSNAWFEWGTNSNVSNKTQTVGVGALSVVKHSDFISGLSSGQTYYYRIVAENAYGKVYGTINSFVADTNTYVVTPPTTPPVVLKPITTVITRSASTLSLVALTIDGGDEAIVTGEKRVYHVTWKNISNQKLSNVVLRVAFPGSMTIESSTRGAFSSADNAVVIDLKTLAPTEGGDAFIFATAGRGVKPAELLVVTANMVFTGTNGVQGDAIAYVTHRAATAQNVLSANSLGAVSFIPTTLFEWILLFILVLILVLLGNHLYGRMSDQGPKH